MKNWLEEGERVIADDGYIGEAPGHVLCPKAIRAVKITEEQREWEQRVRNRQETVNKRFKHFNCFNKRFRHSVVDHGLCFRAIVVLTQISLHNGDGLFEL